MSPAEWLPFSGTDNPGPAAGAQPAAKTKQNTMEASMTLEENKALVQGFVDRVMNEGDTEAITEFTVPGSMFAGGLVGQIEAMKTAFPDLHFTVGDMICEGDQVAVRVMTQGTNSGPLVGLPAFGRLETPAPPTGKSVTSSGLYVFKLSNGRIVSYAAELDQIGMLRQMGWTFTPPG
jgi:predicted ester cyclase